MIFFGDVTMLSFCSGISNYTCVREMLELGANPNELADGFRQKCTPLHMVIYKANGINELEERKKIMSVLIEKGADMHYKGNELYKAKLLKGLDYTEGIDVQAKIFENCEVIDDLLQKSSLVKKDLLQSKIDDVSSVTVNFAEEMITDNSCNENTEYLNDTFFSSMTKLIC